MNTELARAEILIGGLVQGVGFRYFIYKNAVNLGLKGFTENLFNGEVLTVVEGNKNDIEELYKKIIVGPTHSTVNKHKINWQSSKNEYNSFEIRH
jgi:acylphosphatase